jgi:hypothetical protein
VGARIDEDGPSFPADCISVSDSTEMGSVTGVSDAAAVVPDVVAVGATAVVVDGTGAANDGDMGE